MYPHPRQHLAVALLLGCIEGMARLPQCGHLSGSLWAMGFNLRAQQAHFFGIVLHAQHCPSEFVGASVERVPHDPPTAFQPGGGQPDQKLIFER
jgi:hypothetical protein